MAETVKTTDIKLVDFKEGDPLLQQYYQIRADFKNNAAKKKNGGEIPEGKEYPAAPIIEGDKDAKYMLIVENETQSVLGGLRLNDIGTKEKTAILSESKFPTAQRRNIFPGIQDNSKYRALYVDGILFKMAPKKNPDDPQEKDTLIANTYTTSRLMTTMVDYAYGRWPEQASEVGVEKQAVRPRFDLIYFLPKSDIATSIAFLTHAEMGTARKVNAAKNPDSPIDPLYPNLFCFGMQQHQSRLGVEEKPLLGIPVDPELRAHFDGLAVNDNVAEYGIEHFTLGRAKIAAGRVPAGERVGSRATIRSALPIEPNPPVAPARERGSGETVVGA